MNPLEAMLMEDMMSGARKHVHGERKSVEDNIDKVTAIVNSYNRKETFRPGDLITWKSGLKMANVPEDGRPAMVLEVLDQPIVSTYELGSPYYGEVYDIRAIVYLKDNGDSASYLYNSKRMTRWVPSKQSIFED